MFSDRPPFILYCRELGWEEYNEEENTNKKVAIFVIEANIGYNVLRSGNSLHCVKWHHDLEDAIEHAVQTVHKEIAIHEYRQQKGKPQ